MDKTNINFKQQGLVVGWVSFKFSALTFEQEQQLVALLSDLGFNSYRQSKIFDVESESRKISILTNSSNQS
jgi:hypothetical protein